MTHLERHRAESFGDLAKRYDESRPGYPGELVRDLLHVLPSPSPSPSPSPAPAPLVLDVGCGTGKAAREFLAHGARVIGVEVDERMAAVARSHGVEVTVCRFEDFAPPGARFDLVVAGQSWHWLDPVLAPAKAADLLVPGGLLAPFWNRYRGVVGGEPAGVRQAFGRFAPQLASWHSASWEGHETEASAAAIEATGRFDPVEWRRYAWSRAETADVFASRLSTHSLIRVLSPDQRDALLVAIEEAVHEHGSPLTVSYETVVLVASLARPEPRRNSSPS